MALAAAGGRVVGAAGFDAIAEIHCPRTIRIVYRYSPTPNLNP